MEARVQPPGHRALVSSLALLALVAACTASTERPETPGRASGAHERRQAPEGGTPTAGMGAAEPLVITWPDGSVRTLDFQRVGACGTAGCSLKDMLPEVFDGTWCVDSAAGTHRLSQGSLAGYKLRQRRVGRHLALKPPREGHGEAIRSPRAIAPCPAP